ncbi:hypothetical protein VTH06DRAFT_5977 [Thermothelomyces fergusii]
MPALPQPPALPRVITYYQTHHTPSGKPISVLPLIRQAGGGASVTHVIVAAIHINEDPAGLTLNDHAPSHPRFATLWAEMRVLQACGVKVLGMLGGAAQGSYARLDVKSPGADRFEEYYRPLADLVRERGLDGLDLDVEEPMSLAGIVRLIDRLRADFGPGFLITLAPVAAALLDRRRNLSGFDYDQLEALRGREIAWYNAQFYNNWGDFRSAAMYEMLLVRGWPPEKIVVGLLTSPANGHGWVPWDALATVLPLLAARHPRFGGVMGWEYFNSTPGGQERPWEWAQAMTALVKGGRGRAVRGLDGAGESEQPAEEKKASEGLEEADPDEGRPGESPPVPAEFEYYSDGGREEE